MVVNVSANRFNFLLEHPEIYENKPNKPAHRM